MHNCITEEIISETGGCNSHLGDDLSCGVSIKLGIFARMISSDWKLQFRNENSTS